MGIALAIRTRLFVRRAVRTRGRIVGRLDATVHNPDTSSQSSTTQRYVVELSSQGRRRRLPLADAFGGAIADKLDAGDGSIAVLYDPKKPEVVRIDSPWTLYFVPAFLCTPGVLFFLLVIYVWIRS